tara:strand:- start:1911 stop:2108 length:198 start_codon:yes stop_codon:yes gene_type:complete
MIVRVKSEIMGIPCEASLEWSPHEMSEVDAEVIAKSLAKGLVKGVRVEVDTHFTDLVKQALAEMG